MYDRREGILVGMYNVLKGIKKSGFLGRGVVDLNELQKTGENYLVLLDGDELRPPNARDKAIGMMPGMLLMEPLVLGGIGTTPDQLGTKINALRALIVPALLNDTTLRTLITNAPNVRYGASLGYISYEGFATKYSRGSLLGTDMQLNFEIGYPFNPADLL